MIKKIFITKLLATLLLFNGASFAESIEMTLKDLVIFSNGTIEKEATQNRKDAILGRLALYTFSQFDNKLTLVIPAQKMSVQCDFITSDYSKKEFQCDALKGIKKLKVFVDKSGILMTKSEIHITLNPDKNDGTILTSKMRFIREVKSIIN